MRHMRRTPAIFSLVFLSGVWASVALAQQALPTIEVGGARRQASAARPGSPGPGRTLAPAPAQQPSSTLLALRDAPRVPSAMQPAPGAEIATLSRAKIDKSVNSQTTLGVVKYMPSVTVRERFIGDRNGILSLRTNSTLAGAQTMVFADNVLLSNYLGNSPSFPPRWGMVSPAEIERVDIMYGPFSAAYPGNSISGVMTITTRMPEKFEVHYQGDGAFQNFGIFGAKENNLSGHMNLLIGDKINNLRYWVGYDWLDARGQSADFTVANPTVGSGGTPVIAKGWFDVDPQGRPRLIAALNGRDHSQQHLGKVKLDYEFLPDVHAKYQTGLWSFVSDAVVTPFLRRADNGAEFYNSPSNAVQFGPWRFNLPATNPAHANASHLMQAASLVKKDGGVFDFDITGTSYNFLRDYRHAAVRYGVQPGGTNVVQTGTYWRTLDARGTWRPEWDLFGKHEVSMGGHWDVYSLASTQTNTPVFTDTFFTSIQAVNTGKTSTKGVYVQDAWRFHPDWLISAGGRGDFWEAFNGMNQTLTGFNTFGVRAAPTFFTNRYKQSFSPSGGLVWNVSRDFVMRGAIGRAYRYPTVNELFQNLVTPNAITIANPDLQPEISTVYELSGEYTLENLWGSIGWARPRVTLFMDDRWNSIANLIDPALRTSANVNVDKVRFRGVEGAIDMKDFLTERLDINGSVTFTDAKTLSNWRQPNTQGMQFLRIPRIRLRGLAVYTPPWEPNLILSAGVRYQTAAFNNLDNSDFNHDVLAGGSSSFLFFDAKASYRLTPEWTLAAGVDNIGRYKAYAFHPYPQRTYYLSLRYDFAEKTPGGFMQSLPGLNAL
jgi:iron complex outermembrane receptor protein